LSIVSDKPNIPNMPNILFILADDLGWNDVGYHGSPIRTPNIDRLVATGVELDYHYVCPVCTPTRTALLTGRYPGRFGKHATVPSNDPILPDRYETLAGALRRAGYDTGLFGKWHLGSRSEYGPNAYGFNTAYGSLAGGVDPYNHCYKRGPYMKTWHRNGSLIDEPGHVTDLIAGEACRWIAARSDTCNTSDTSGTPRSPWFCYVPFTAVHIPVDVPSAWLDKYADKKYDDDPARDMSYKRYAAYTSHMDAAVGRLIDTLKEHNQFHNTIVVFASDNGATMQVRGDLDNYPGWHWPAPRLGSNAPLRGQKAQLYEGGIRTPAVISWPGILSPGKCSVPIHVVDWMPTFTKLVGYCPESDPQWDGMDIWPVIAGSPTASPASRSFYWNLRGTQFAVRRGPWKLILDEAAEKCELFNLEADPHEQNELSAALPEIVGQLKDVIAAERQKDDSSKRPDAPN